MKNSKITTIAAVAVFGLTGIAHADPTQEPTQSEQPAIETDIVVTRGGEVENSFNKLDVSKTVRVDASKTANITKNINVANAEKGSTAVFSTGYGSVSIATSTAHQDSSFPVLDNVVTPVVGATVAVRAGSDENAGLAFNDVYNTGSVGSGVGVNVGGANFQSINTATSLAIGNGSYSVPQQ